MHSAAGCRIRSRQSGRGPRRNLQGTYCIFSPCSAWLLRGSVLQETGRDPITSEALEEDDLLELATAQVRRMAVGSLPVGSDIWLPSRLAAGCFDGCPSRSPACLPAVACAACLVWRAPTAWRGAGCLELVLLSSRVTACAAADRAAQLPYLAARLLLVPQGVKPRPTPATSIPGLLSLFQNVSRRAAPFSLLHLHAALRPACIPGVERCLPARAAAGGSCMGVTVAAVSQGAGIP